MADAKHALAIEAMLKPGGGGGRVFAKACLLQRAGQRAWAHSDKILCAAGNIVLSLTLASIIPLTIWAFTLPLPFLDPAPPIGANFIVGTAILLIGLFTYNSPLWWPALKRRGSPMLTAPE